MNIGNFCTKYILVHTSTGLRGFVEKTEVRLVTDSVQLYITDGEIGINFGP